ncbi:MAG: acyl-CoA thioesterase [Candidatus Omnitrophota bacterium]
MKVKIYYHHTDSGGVVYYANYLKFFEEARTEFFAQKGLPLNELAAKGVMFVVARQEAVYKFPARYADILDIETRLQNVSAVRLEFVHESKNQDGKLICAGKAVLVCVGRDFRPQPIPDAVKNQMEAENA